MTKSITLQRCANGVICTPEGAGISEAHVFPDVKANGEAFLAYIVSALAPDAPPTLVEVRTELAATSTDLSHEDPTQLP